MTRPVITVRPDTRVGEIARLMVEHAISGIPVVDDAGRVVGIVTESDLIVRHARLHFPVYLPILGEVIPIGNLRRLNAELRRALGTTAADVMTSPVRTVDVDTPLEEVVTLLVDHRIGRVPVLEQGRLAGIITRADIVRLIAREEAGEVIGGRLPGASTAQQSGGSER
jgi:CBS domain-containing protein